MAFKKNLKFFCKNWVFTCSAPSMEYLPCEGPPELAFIGRSNVGKSTLINALINYKNLSRTSNAPGRTQAINFFVPFGYYERKVVPPIALVDMPGYGFAKVSKKNLLKWKELTLEYFRTRSSLRRVYLLIDARHGFEEKDYFIQNFLEDFAVSYQIIITKSDKSKGNNLKIMIDETYKVLEKKISAYPKIFITSSETKYGISNLRSSIEDFINFCYKRKKIKSYNSKF